MDRERPIVLAGMMGSGKTFIGRALATATGRRYVDNDELVEQATGSTARELLRRGGTPAVRAAEADALRHGLAVPGGPILGIAAGTILDPALRAILDTDDLRVVWLRARPETLARRVLADDDAPDGEHRPWHEAGALTPQAWLAREDARRARLYREVADLEVRVDDDDGNDRPADDIVTEIVAGLGLRVR